MDWSFNPLFLGFIGSLLAGISTGIGSFGVFFIRKLSEKIEDILLSFAAGIMLAASVFSLIIPGIEYATEQYFDKMIAVGIVIIGILSGSILLWSLDNYLPHEHFITGPEGRVNKSKLARVWLFIIAITIHNFPEGMAVGVSFFGDISAGISLATGIGLQNIPEGLAVSISLVSLRYKRSQAFWAGFLSGIVEPIGGILGAGLVWLIKPMLPFILSFAAGAMIYVICHEIIPETHIQEHKTYATFSLIIGFVIMLFLDITL